LPALAHCAGIHGAAKYVSRTMSAYFESSRHQSPATSPVYGALGTRITGCAPSDESRFIYIIPCRRYWALFDVHGVTRFAPLSSFSAMIGRVQPLDSAAVEMGRFAGCVCTRGLCGSL